MDSTFRALVMGSACAVAWAAALAGAPAGGDWRVAEKIHWYASGNAPAADYYDWIGLHETRLVASDIFSTAIAPTQVDGPYCHLP
jgi:hypothetical protein